MTTDPYIILDSDRLFTYWLESLDVLTMHPSGMPTAMAMRLVHEHVIPDLSDDVEPQFMPVPQDRNFEIALAVYDSKVARGVPVDDWDDDEGLVAA